MKTNHVAGPKVAFKPFQPRRVAKRRVYCAPIFDTTRNARANPNRSYNVTTTWEAIKMEYRS